MAEALRNESGIENYIIAYPFVKWAGGKRQLLDKFNKIFPARDSFNTYHEPFLGGGAVFFDLQPEKAILIDVNEELINVYQVIQYNVEGLIKELKKHKKNHCKEYYYQIRKWDRKNGYQRRSAVKRAARFIYLNRTCFNGLYRVNSKNQFNVPMGSYKNPKILDEENLINIHKLLDGDRVVTIKCSDFKAVLEYAQKDDFIYFDPPYYPLDETSFTSYTKNNFGPCEQQELAEVYLELHNRGCKLALSNSDIKKVQLLYNNPAFRKIKLDARRNINSNGKGRGPVKELLIINY